MGQGRCSGAGNNHPDPAWARSLWASRSALYPSQKCPHQFGNYWFSFLPHPQAPSSLCWQTGACCKSWRPGPACAHPNKMEREVGTPRNPLCSLGNVGMRSQIKLGPE